MLRVPFDTWHTCDTSIPIYPERSFLLLLFSLVGFHVKNISVRWRQTRVRAQGSTVKGRSRCIRNNQQEAFDPSLNLAPLSQCCCLSVFSFENITYGVYSNNCDRFTTGNSELGICTKKQHIILLYYYRKNIAY